MEIVILLYQNSLKNKKFKQNRNNIIIIIIFKDTFKQFNASSLYKINSFIQKNHTDLKLLYCSVCVCVRARKIMLLSAFFAKDDFKTLKSTVAG